MTLRIAMILFGLHLIAAFTTLAFSPESCAPGDVGCGDETVSSIVQKSESGEASIGGSVLTTVWDGVKAIFGPLIGLISFDHPWLSGNDIPELAAWLIGAVRGFLALVHVWIIYKAFTTVLGRT